MSAQDSGSSKSTSSASDPTSSYTEVRRDRIASEAEGVRVIRNADLDAILSEPGAVDLRPALERIDRS